MFVVQLIIVKCAFANSISGPWMIRPCTAFGVVGLSWAGRLPLKTEIANIARALFMFTPKKLNGQMIEVTFSRLIVWPYGIGGLGTGETPQIADAQGGRGGVGISSSLPWVAAEPPLIHAPVKVSLLR